MHIASYDLENTTLIVAEIGNNHEGRVDIAKELVRQAAECGAHAVKFQTFQTKYLISEQDQARFERLRSFELSFTQFEELHRLATSLGLLFLSTPLDLESARFLEKLVDAYKVASGDNNFYPLIEEICKTGKPIIFSTGASALEQVAGTKRFIEETWRTRGTRQELAILHCVSSYPTPPDQANLAAIPFLKQHLGGTIGYSDHTIGIDACLVAASLGAQIIEKHFTLDKSFSDFRDHTLSADPTDLKELVERIHRVRELLGKPEKTIQANEAQIATLIRRSVVAASHLSVGHRLEARDLTWIRPGGGLPPGEENRVIGKRLKRQIAFGERITAADVE